MASPTLIVFFIQSALTKQYLMYDGSTVSTHTTKEHQDLGYIHIVPTYVNTTKYFQLLSDPLVKFGRANIVDTALAHSGYPPLQLDGTSSIRDDCSANVSHSSMENLWQVQMLASGTATIGVRLFVMTNSGENWYLRAPLIGGTIELVCEDYVTNIERSEDAYLSEMELKFDLVGTEVKSSGDKLVID